MMPRNLLHEKRYAGRPKPFVGPIERHEYRCANCGAAYPLVRDDNEAKQASEWEWGMQVREETHSIICNDCHKAFTAWFNGGGMQTGPGSTP